MVKPWVDGPTAPFKLLEPLTEMQTIGKSPSIIRVANEMTFAHNVLLRSLSAIYLQAPHVHQPQDIRDFLSYCQFFIEELQFHHHMEESTLFPKIEEYTKQPGIMRGNVEQHEAFERGVEEFKGYVYGVKVEEYSGEKLKKLVVGFQDVLTKHLAEEPSSLLALDQYGGDNVLRAWDELEKVIISKITDMHKVLPFALGSNDKTWKEGKYNDWPSFPFFMPYVVKWVYGWKYRGVWRFSPCDMYGSPRELAFVGDEA